MTTREWILWGANHLASVTSIAHKEAEILLAHDKGWSRIELHLNYDKNIVPLNYEAWIKQRATHYPLEYLTQKVSFFSEEFFIHEGILIPRPETELLIEQVVFLLKHSPAGCLIDVGTGSGVIAIMLAKLLPQWRVIACDINPLALELTQKNAKKHGVYIECYESNLLDNIDISLDAVISNPPYIANDYRLDINVLCEPHNALFGGVCGDEILVQLIEQTALRGIPYLACETGYDQRESMEKELTKWGYKSIQWYNDYASFHRGFIASQCFKE